MPSWAVYGGIGLVGVLAFVWMRRQGTGSTTPSSSNAGMPTASPVGSLALAVFPFSSATAGSAATAPIPVDKPVHKPPVTWKKKSGATGPPVILGGEAGR